MRTVYTGHKIVMGVAFVTSSHIEVGHQMIELFHLMPSTMLFLLYLTTTTLIGNAAGQFIIVGITLYACID